MPTPLLSPDNAVYWLAAALLLILLLGLATVLRGATRLRQYQAEQQRLAAERAALQQQLDQAARHHQESLDMLRTHFKEQQQAAAAQLEALSARVLANNMQQLQAVNNEQMHTLLEPLRRQLTDLDQALRHTNTANATQKASLEGLINRMLEQTRRLDTEAANLAKALKGDTKKQGDWGELILERLLEESGLKKGEEYYLQQTYQTDAGRAVRPDVVVRFPENRCLIIDSKVSLTAYAAYAAAEDDTTRCTHLAAHVDSVRKHIRELAAKDYAGVVQEAVGYVLMFMPNEAAYMAAVQARPELPLEGYRQRVLLISPTNLLMALQLAYHLWQKERQTRNVEAIFKKAAAIYDKCAGLAESFDDVGKCLRKALDAHEEAMRRFNTGRGNLTRQVEDLRQMGISPSKRLSLADDADSPLPPA